MELARSLDVEAAETELVIFDGTPTLVSTRYDRRVDPDGSITRIHQEDGCQALSILVGTPRQKYQHPEGDPSLGAIAAALDQWGPAAARYELRDHVLVTAAIDDAASAVPSVPEERLETIHARARMLRDDPARR